MTAPVLDHGAVGNGRLLALISPSGSVEWLCMPRFDSPSVFASILDAEHGGDFRIEGAAGSTGRMAYVPNTNVLCTRVTAPDGAFDVFDFAPRIPQGSGVSAPIELHRLVIPVAGAPRIRVRFDPRPDYGRVQERAFVGAEAIELAGGFGRLFLRSNAPLPYVLEGRPFDADRPRYFVFSHGKPSEFDSASAVRHALQRTIEGWRAWVKTCGVTPFATPAVLRSALCLKLHASLDTGAIIAAATTSIPESLGSERNWDYRYCWLRDAAFVVEALRRLSHLAEGEAFVRFLRDVAESGPLQPLYGITGERDLPESQLEHLAGFGGSRPVRVGNSAASQKQNDLQGEMILCLESILTDPRIVPDDTPGLLRLVERLVEEAIDICPREDTGLWEYRTTMRHHTFSRVMCWVAATRGARIERLHGDQARAGAWESWAAAERERTWSGAFNGELGFLTQGIGGRNGDASNLLLPTLGFLEPGDPRFVSTVRAYERDLVENGFMMRYRHPDDFGKPTSAFTICSFWWAEALALMGELDQAVEVFDRVLRRANPQGLFSEDIDPATGRLLGNFPQAYTHVGLINAATTIGECLEVRNGKFRAWR